MGALLELPAFAVFLFALACIIALKGYNATFGYLLRLLAGEFQKVSVLGIHPLSFIGNEIDAIDDAINDALVTAITNSEWAFHKFMKAQSYAWQELSGVVADLAEGTEAALGVLRRSTIPALLAALFGPLAALVYQLRHNIGALAAHVASLPHDVTKVVEATPTIVKPVDIQKITTIVKADAQALPRAIANPWPDIRGIEGSLDRLWDRTSGVVKGLTVGGIIGLVGATIFNHFGLGWLRCRGVNRLGNKLCGLSGLIETLLGDAIDALIITDLCQFTEAIAYAARRFEPVLIDFVDVENALIGCGGASLPPALGVKLPALPPVTGYALV